MTLSDTKSQSANAAVLHEDQGKQPKSKAYTALLLSREVPLDNTLLSMERLQQREFKVVGSVKAPFFCHIQLLRFEQGLADADSSPRPVWK